MAHLTEFDRKMIRELRKAGVLADVNPHRLDQRNGVIMIPCSDGDQSHDLYRRQVRYNRRHRLNPRIHSLMLNGGAIAIPANSPLNTQVPKDQVLINDLGDAMTLKNIKVVALYAHAPCGAAGICRLNVLQVIDLLVTGKRRIKDTFEDARVACFFHVDYGLRWPKFQRFLQTTLFGHRRRTYFVSKMKWKKWKAEHPEYFS